ncbi:MAG: indolepyruvate oxidoreductase subunit beta [Methanobacteriota archaeon]
MSKPFSVVIVGVGGQGVLFVAQLVGEAAMAEGKRVVMSEVHGMAQRGGVVTATVRIGDRVKSPLAAKGEVDVLLGLEPLETYRALPCGSATTRVITSDEPAIPPGVSMGFESYPPLAEIVDGLKQASALVKVIPSVKIAGELGMPVVANVVMLGAFAATEGCPLKRESFSKAMDNLLSEKVRAVNVKAIERGYEAGKA